MDKFIGTKVIKARPEPMTYAEYCNVKGWDCPEGRENEVGFMVGYPNAQGGFEGQLEGGCDYISWSPQDVFEAAYKPMTGMPFGMAIEALKAGHKVARAGWNGKGIYLILVDEALGLKRVGYDGENCDIRLQQHIAIDTTGLQTDNPDAPKSIVPWLSSQTDMLADDWMIVE